MDSMAV